MEATKSELQYCRGCGVDSSYPTAWKFIDEKWYCSECAKEFVKELRNTKSLARFSAGSRTARRARKDRYDNYLEEQGLDEELPVTIAEPYTRVFFGKVFPNYSIDTSLKNRIIHDASIGMSLRNYSVKNGDIKVSPERCVIYCKTTEKSVDIDIQHCARYVDGALHEKTAEHGDLTIWEHEDMCSDMTGCSVHSYLRNKAQTG